MLKDQKNFLVFLGKGWEVNKDYKIYDFNFVIQCISPLFISSC